MNVELDDIEAMIAMMEQSAKDEAERLDAMSPDERVEYIRERDAAMEEFRQHMRDAGVPEKSIVVGTAELLISLQKALDGKPPTIH